jgi:hypothetical protein
MTNTKKKFSVAQKVAATAGVLAALSPTTVEADFIFVNDRPIAASPFDGQGSTVDWDIDGIGGAEYQLWVRSSAFFLSFYVSSNSFSFNSVFYGILNFASNGYFGTELNGRGLVGDGGLGANALQSSFRVGPTLATYDWGAINIPYRSAARFDSNFFSNQNSNGGTAQSNLGVDFDNFQQGSNFLGFRFESNGDMHYGFANVEFSGSQLTISSWGYESDPDTAVHVRAVPEPNSLALLAMGAAGIMTMRRRRKSDDVN